KVKIKESHSRCQITRIKIQQSWFQSYQLDMNETIESSTCSGCGTSSFSQCFDAFGDMEDDFRDDQHLPVNSEKALLEFDSLLNCDEDLKRVASVISKVGGNGIKDSTERIMTRLLTERIAVLYNWRGTQYKDRPSKLAFGQFKNVFKLISRSVRMINSGAGSDQKIENSITYWLKHANGRIRTGPTPALGDTGDQRTAD
ncbi:unnamed protein product, partial [Allacma fusca]